MLTEKYSVKFTKESIICSKKYVSVKNIFTNELNVGLSLQVRVENLVHGVETQICGKEKVSAAAINKCHADNLLRHGSSVASTGCYLEDLLREIAVRNEWKESQGNVLSAQFDDKYYFMKIHM